MSAIPIAIDSSSLIDAFNLSEKQIGDLLDFMVKEVTAEFANKWEEMAGRNLHSSRDEYVRGIQVIDQGRFKGAVVLTGFFPVALETGISAYDMKEGLLKGKNAKVSKSGTRYNTVPFRFSTPGALGESAIFSSKLPEEVYRAIMDKPFVRKVQGGGIATQGLKVDEIPVKFRAAITRPAPVRQPLPIRFKEYTHKSSIYKGVSRVNDPVTGQNRYTSFRRVSDNSDPNSWVHPGFDAKNLGEKTLSSFDPEKITTRAIDLFLRSNGLA